MVEQWSEFWERVAAADGIFQNVGLLCGAINRPIYKSSHNRSEVTTEIVTKEL
jgi:hypothetical protein